VSVTVRFAPSPTGLLHIGNIRPALLNWLFALAEAGRFILRYDDTDTARSRSEYADAIAEDLAWLGIEPDLVVRQSDRLALYEAAAERLKAAGRLYRCYETADELERRRRRQLGRGQPPLYDRAALKLTDEDHARLAAEGRKPHWRFRLDGKPAVWTDLIRGAQSVDTAALSDPVLVREDGSFLYTFTSVVDDIDLSVSHVIRGEDHVTNTGVQIEIFLALGGAVPTFAHHNLLASATGEALSKRLGSLSLRSLRDDGFEPMAVASLAVLTGSDAEIHPYPSLDELARHVRLEGLSRSTAKFDPHDLETLNAHLVHTLSYAQAAPRLEKLGVGGGEAFWLAVRANCARLRDAADWWRVVTGTPAAPDLSDEDRAFCRAAFDLLPEEPWNETTWSVWTKAVAAATGRKGRALFMPLRQALTGLDHGPELKALLPLIGRRRTSARRP
jgi:glutamyl-tRNA synthetase